MRKIIASLFTTVDGVVEAPEVVGLASSAPLGVASHATAEGARQ